MKFSPSVRTRYVEANTGAVVFRRGWVEKHSAFFDMFKRASQTLAKLAEFSDADCIDILNRFAEAEVGLAIAAIPSLANSLHFSAQKMF